MAARTESRVGSSGALLLRLRPAVELTDELLLRISSLNPDLRLERTSEGDLVIIAPEGGWSGKRSAEILGQLWLWNERTGTGVVFGSSAGFRLPNGAVRAPDVAWVRKDRLEALSPQEREGFLPLCPDLVVEIRSPTDSLPDLQAKMEEYLSCGAQLGWLVDPFDRRVHVYRPGRPSEVLESPDTLPADPVLPGFTLDLRRVW